MDHLGMLRCNSRARANFALEEQEQLLLDPKYCFQLTKQCSPVGQCKVEFQTNMGSKEESTEQTQLQERLVRLRVRIREIDKSIEKAKVLYQNLTASKKLMQTERQDLEQLLLQLDRSPTETEHYQFSFDNKYSPSSNHVVITQTSYSNFRVQKVLEDMQASLGMEVRLSNINQPHTIQKNRKPIMSGSCLLRDIKKSLSPPLLNKLSPRNPSSNIFQATKINKTNKTGIGSKRVIIPETASIFQKLHRQRSDFNDLKTKYWS